MGGSGLKVDSAVTNVGWGVGGGLYSNLHLPFIVLRALLDIYVFLLCSLAGLASKPPTARFSELIILLYVLVVSYR